MIRTARRLAFALLGLCGTLAVSAEASAFEGMLRFTLEAGGQGSGELTFYSNKAGDLRLEIESSKAPGFAPVMIFNKNLGKTYLVMDRQRQYMEAPGDMAKAQARAAAEADPSRFEVKKLGASKIAGQSCTHVQITDTKEKSTTDMWLSNDIMFHEFSSLWGQSPGFAANHEMFVLLKKKGIRPGFPLKMSGKDEKGNTFSMVAKQVARKKYPSSKFTPPAGYTLADPMRALMGAMGGALGGSGAEGLSPEQLEALKKALQQQGR